MKQIRSPFKFLDPFTQADCKVFFGRDSEIEALYRMVLQTPLLLLYGLSGTGKTSLVQCGLAGKFDGTDWLPFWMRREDDINRSLHRALDAARAGIAAPAPADITTSGKIEQLYSHFLRPVFLIFDQFEELYVFGDAAEHATFVEELKSILEAELPCTILLSVREEYLGRLYPLEKEIPSLFNFRMRVERMDAAHVTEVLSESFRQFNIGVEPPVPERYGEIIENVSQGRSGIELPYLQVYLDRLYREDHARSYPGGTDLPEGQWPPLTFSKAEIADFGTITDVLDNFLREQRDALRGALLAKFPKAKVPENAVDQLLDAFVSAEGTKRPISVVREQGLVVVAERQRALFPPVSAEVLTYCIERLEQARLLRSGETSLELAHDTLALVIEKQRSAEQRQLAEVRRRIEAGYREHADSLQSDHPYYFDKGQLARIEPFLPKLALEPEQADFLEKSRVEAGRLENAEKERVERELRLMEEKLAAEEKLTNVALEKTREAEIERDKARVAREEAERNLKKYEAASAEIVDALAREADNLIYRLDYAGAAAKLRTAADLDQPTDAFKKALAEVAFFWNEAELTLEAVDFLKTAKQRDVPCEKSAIQRWIKSYAGDAWYEMLWWRYYPEMLPVPAGEAHIDGKKTSVSAFKMARTPTTVWQYGLYLSSCRLDICDDGVLKNIAWGINGDNPVVGISWFDAALYANWLSYYNFGRQVVYDMGHLLEVSQGRLVYDYEKLKINATAKGYRLPAEVEWEYAARGGPACEAFEYAGSDYLDSVGWYSRNSSRRPQPVAGKKPNSLGLYDMSGNVSEWCEDWHKDYPATFPANYRGPDSGSHRVLRGGSWFDSSCELAFRDSADPKSGLTFYGFRLVLVP